MHSSALKRERVETLSEEFERQVENLLQKGYSQAAKIKAEAFRQQLAPLGKRIKTLAKLERESQEGYLPFVIVIKSDWIAADKIMPLVEREGQKGFIQLYPVEAENFKPIQDVKIPKGVAYLLVGIDRGQETLNLAPTDALKIIKKQNRSPLTIEEGIAIITHYPEFLKKNHCFSLLASDCGDKRVPALWLSENKPKLGWCWAGNPHTWLGSASCGSRIGV